MLQKVAIQKMILIYSFIIEKHIIESAAYCNHIYCQSYCTLTAEKSRQFM